MRLAVYRGALTPRELDAPEIETAALASGAAIHDLGWMRRVAVRGSRPFPLAERNGDQYRKRPVSKHRRLESGAECAGPHPGRPDGVAGWRGAVSAAAEPAGRRKIGQGEDQLLGTPFAGESGLELEIAADQFDKLLAHLNRFIIMDDVELVPLGEEQVGEAGSETAIGLTGPQAERSA